MLEKNLLSQKLLGGEREKKNYFVIDNILITLKLFKKNIQISFLSK